MPANRLPPAPNEPLSGISEEARYWLRVEHHVFPQLDAGRINLPDAAAKAGATLSEIKTRYRVYVTRPTYETRRFPDS